MEIGSMENKAQRWREKYNHYPENLVMINRRLDKTTIMLSLAPWMIGVMGISILLKKDNCY